MAEKKPGMIEVPRIPKILKEAEQTFKREQGYAGDETRVLWFSQWDSIPFEKRNEFMQKFRAYAPAGRTPAELESIRRGIEEKVVERVISRFGPKYKEEAKRELIREVKNASTEMLNRLLEQELKRSMGDKKSDEMRTEARREAEKFAEAHGRVFTTGGKAAVESKTVYKADPESFRPFSPEDLASYKKKLEDLKKKYELTQLNNKIAALRSSGSDGELSTALSQQLSVLSSQYGVSPESGVERQEQLRHQIALVDRAIKKGGIGGTKVVIKESSRAELFSAKSGTGVESLDARGFAERVRSTMVRERLDDLLASQGLSIEDLQATKDGRNTLAKLKKQIVERIQPMIRAGAKGGAAIAKSAQFSEAAERTAINSGKELAKEKMGSAAWSELSAEEKEREGEKYADRFYKPFVFRVGPTGHAEPGMEFAKADPKASTLLNQKPQLFTASGWGMKMRSVQGADKRVGRDVPNDAFVDVKLWKSLGGGHGRKVLEESKYLNPDWVKAVFGASMLTELMSRKAAGSESWALSTKITKQDLRDVGIDPEAGDREAAAGVPRMLFDRALADWHSRGGAKREVDPTLSAHIYVDGKLVDVTSKEGKRELFIRGARATLYGPSKVPGEKKIIAAARKMVEEDIAASDLYAGDSDEMKSIRAAKIEELTPLRADLILSKEPAPTKSYIEKVQKYNERFRDKKVQTVEQATRGIRGKRIASAPTPDAKIDAMAEETVFERYAKVVNQRLGQSPRREDFKDRMERVKGRFTKVSADDQYTAAMNRYAQRYNDEFGRLATNLESDLAEERTKLRSGRIGAASSPVIIRKKGEGLEGLGLGFGSYDLGSKATVIAVGGLVAFAIFKAFTEGRK